MTFEVGKTFVVAGVPDGFAVNICDWQCSRRGIQMVGRLMGGV